MHRSGTTMLAKLLHTNGVHMGPLLDPNFESRLYSWDLMNYQNFLLGTWDHPYSMERDFQSQNYKLASDRFVRQIERRSKLHRLIKPLSKIGFKHPICSLLLPELSKIGNICFIRIDRDKDAVVKSLQVRRIVGEPSLFPGRFSGGMKVYNYDYSSRLYDYYIAELDCYMDLFTVSLRYEDLVDRRLRSKSLCRLEEVLGRKVKYKDGFFNGKI